MGKHYYRPRRWAQRIRTARQDEEISGGYIVDGAERDRMVRDSAAWQFCAVGEALYYGQVERAAPTYIDKAVFEIVPRVHKQASRFTAAVGARRYVDARRLLGQIQRALTPARREAIKARAAELSASRAAYARRCREIARQEEAARFARHDKAAVFDGPASAGLPSERAFLD